MTALGEDRLSSLSSEGAQSDGNGSELELLRTQLDGSEAAVGDSDRFGLWPEKTLSDLPLVLGEDHALIFRFELIKFTSMIVSLGGGNRQAFDQARLAGMIRARAVLDAAIFEIQGVEPVDEDLDRAGGVELWSKIDHLDARTSRNSVSFVLPGAFGAFELWRSSLVGDATARRRARLLRPRAPRRQPEAGAGYRR